MKRGVAADARVDHGLLVDDEQEGVVVVRVLVLVALVRRLVRDAPTLDDARALADAAQAANTPRPWMKRGP